MKNKEFILEVTPNGKAVLNISLKNQIEIVDTKQFFKKYKISNFFKGKFFVKRLIKKIFNHQIKDDLSWKVNFWDKIIIYKFKTKINNQINIKKFEQLLIENTVDKRLKDIKKYQIILDKGVDLGCPLFITGKAANYLGAKIKDDTFFILDGSRRIISNILCNLNPDILIIDID